MAIATRRTYQEVFDALFKSGIVRNAPNRGVIKASWKAYLKLIGWTWTPTMFIGQGCKVHLRSDELPGGRLVVGVSKHLVAVIDGVIYDTHDPRRDRGRCVYGYFWQ